VAMDCNPSRDSRIAPVPHPGRASDARARAMSAETRNRMIVKGAPWLTLAIILGLFNLFGG